ncbi:hypothetical protein BABINDRAFT_158974 [Babjeviella inositovora NRRL Y-12698]|uniref:Protein YTP1-like C-terminal domain-containing protein n=1 Tax=Babjeviella inositovora NRRL Y-12698 TaxID=984486 RepID=A0A1E3QXM1_9ASCO|nr:uncharacterized protein BABINDRAFT_158974 [Babjeviella inositovora NRRL Y-12698]ODQ82361.1 hypothetical protein BABINDRAFT_158974 [Babjeviella inositovora NRRL Y-12698]
MKFSLCYLIPTLSILLAVRAHDDDENGMAGMDMATETTVAAAIATQNATALKPVPHREMHHHGVPILQTNLKPEERLYWEAYNTTTYLTIETPHKSSLYIHMASIFILAVFMQPIALVLHNVLSNWYLPVALANLGLLTFSMVNLGIFSGSVPELYPNNAYTKITWVIIVMGYLHFGFAVIHYAAKWCNGDSTMPPFKKYEFVPLASFNEQEGEMPGTPTSHSSTLFEANSPSESFELENDENMQSFAAPKKTRVLTFRDNLFSKLFQSPAMQKLVNLFGTFGSIGFNALNYPCWMIMFVYIPTGLATVGCLGMGNKIFNILAHFIKGGVFFALGVLSLARYSGAFTNKGWAWNQRTITSRSTAWERIQPKGLITMEMIESSLILFYGATNVFMEHLASPGGAWSPKDLQHVSIAFLYIGGGLCGVITEVKLSQWRYETFMKNNHFLNNDENGASHITGGCVGYSPNPFPSFTIFWTGILMSKHAQASQLATEIHVQWGTLLSYGSFFRLFTILIMYLKPTESRNFKPSRPMTELITSFTLLAGGVIFMESTDPVVLAMEYKGLTAMFTLNVSIGCVALLMAWEMSLFAFKDWMVERRKKNELHISAQTA